MENKSRDKKIMAWLTFSGFILLIGFAVVWNTITGNTDHWYWGAIGALIAALAVVINWFISDGKGIK